MNLHKNLFNSEKVLRIHVKIQTIKILNEFENRKAKESRMFQKLLFENYNNISY